MIYYSKNGLIVRDSEREDVESLKNRLRSEDAQEVIAAGNASAEEALGQSFSRSSLRYTVDKDGATVAMFGVVPDSILGEGANVWFLGAPEMSQIKKTFVRLSRGFIDIFLLQYSLLWNIVDGRYVKSISWLKSCGAQFDKEPVNINGVDFYRFVIIRRA